MRTGVCLEVFARCGVRICIEFKRMTFDYQMWCYSSPKTQTFHKVRVVSKYFCETDKTSNVVHKPYQLNKGQSGHVYIVKEREFLKSGENVFKIGKSTNIKSRMPSYPKNSLIVIIVHTDNYDVHQVERELIQHLKDDPRFVQRTDIGSEYFQCCINDLMEEYMILQKTIYKYYS
jgi:hypothetical protein